MQVMFEDETVLISFVLMIFLLPSCNQSWIRIEENNRACFEERDGRNKERIWKDQ